MFVTFQYKGLTISELNCILTILVWLYDPPKAVLLLCIIGVFVCLVFLMLSRLSIAPLRSPAGYGLTSWLLLVMFIVFLLLSHVVSWIRCGT